MTLGALLALVLFTNVTSLAHGSPLAFPATLTSIHSAYNDSAFIITEDGDLQLKLCECERAVGAPAGLSCDKAGWFVSSWERSGQWVTPFSLVGGGTVPLSHAICCRPCLPAELPPDATGRIPVGQKPLAVVSLSCHVSTESPPGHCEAKGSSLVAGWSESVQVFAAADTHYPVNAARCCTPALLLSNGDAWELERCDCAPAPTTDAAGVSCGGTNTNHLLAGYSAARATPMGQSVPVAPADCCGLCLSSRFHPMSECDDLQGCNQRGVCNLGACDCFKGWAGPSCAIADGHGDGAGMPAWATSLVVLSSLAVACMLVLLTTHILRMLGDSSDEMAGAEEGSPHAPLIIRLDADDGGSVGSVDSDSEGSEDEEGQLAQRLGAAIATLNTGVTSGATAAAAGEGDAPAAAGEGGAPAAAGEGGAAAAEEEGGGEAGSGGTPSSSTGDGEGAALSRAVSASGPEREEGGEVQGLPPGRGTEGADPGKATAGREVLGPMGRDCSVCMSRECQVVLIPCGHICLCRRCSRRLQRCPMCRKDIARRQRLYM